MSDDHDELLARLRSVDPASSLPPADPSRVARLLEDTMSNLIDHEGPTGGASDEPTRESGTRGRNPLTWLVAAAAVLLIAGAGAIGLLNHGQDPDPVPSATNQPTVTTLSAPPAGTSGKCQVPNAELLATQTLAVDGTVASIVGDVVTLVPSRFYAGAATDLVKVEAAPAEMQALVGATEFQEGGRYLVSASDGRVTVCGFTGPFTPELAALYDEAFPS